MATGSYGKAQRDFNMSRRLHINGQSVVQFLRAEEFEKAYNHYFEETAGANEKLTTYARDAVASTTVRRDEKKGRKRARDLAREKRETERQEREANPSG